MSGKKRELTTREIQLATLEILKQFIEICEDNDLCYYLAYGSLIGAIRHQGFIPWDDDLDVYMPRPDYNKLLDFFDDPQHDTGSLLAIHTTENKLIPFLITRISDTHYKQVGEYDDEIPQMGTFIDIYPLDGLYGSSKEAHRESRKVHTISSNYMRAGKFSTPYKLANPLMRVVKSIWPLILKDARTYWEELSLYTTVEEYEQADYVACKIWNDTKGSLIVDEKSDYGEGKQAIFEGLKVRIPDNADAILRRIYGDYMQLPPVKERIGHHYYSIVPRDDN
ncbi:LicD family protein [Bifidobacterium xylocopae]|nr:LicD family protein [Bifidobacterium xylocopae]